MSTWVVTGSNRGIGLELCRQLKARGEDVIAACRTATPALLALGVRLAEGVDLTREDAAEPIRAALGDARIDVLVHNAGLLLPDAPPGTSEGKAKLAAVDPEKLRRQVEVNAIGPLLLTRALLPHLGRGSKVAFISSRSGSIGDNGSGGNYGYRMSKAALNMAAVSLTRDLAPEGILIAVLHPGFIRTDLTGGLGNDDPPVAAQGLIARIDELTPERSGRFFHANGQELPW